MATSAVAVVTGACGELGLETARWLARDHHVVLSDPSRERLHRALDRLDSLGVSAESIVADVTDRRSVEVLMAAASSAGHVATVVHAGGTTSPSDSPDSIIRTRVLGTINVTAATLAVAGIGTTLVHATARSTPHVLTKLPHWAFRLAPTDPEGLASALGRLASVAPARLAPAVAHTLSGTFVDWYTQRMGRVFRESGARLHPVDGDAVVQMCRSGLAPAHPLAASAA
ncbi:SDR family NAD(P)-dependent oxidoreductase [Aeromicrobium sp.]|uniref:SDR family NAD(P)-dependent oxidoreductase n=1 Tax=Aeromicrobium sp. TaxID=1871063 RepID=UPI0028A7CD1C|nr:SDR family NAD(P)-dependent oxidoreductase [Aeromicrobium sp.]